MRYRVRLGEHQGNTDVGTKEQCLAWAAMRSERHPELLVYVVECAPAPALFGRVRASFQAGRRLT